MKILANDGMAKSAVDYFRSRNIDVDLGHYNYKELEEVMGDFDVLVVRSKTKLDKNLLEKAKDSNLKVIIRAGVGLDNIDVEAGKKLGFYVTNTPNSSKDSVAEIVLSQILNLARFIPIANSTTKKGQWNKNLYEGIEINGKKLGIIGYGRIGRALASKASALGMNVYCHDIYCDGDECAHSTDFDELLKTCDFISIHVPSLSEPIIEKKELDLMKESAFLINYARGTAVNEEDLIEALKNGDIAGAAIDVFPCEPSINPEYFELDNIILTPHIGSSTKDAQNKIGQEIIDIVMEKFDLRGEA